MPSWLVALAWLSLALGGASALAIVSDLAGGRAQRMAIMNAVWPLTALYMGPFGLWAYWMLGRMPKRGQAQMAMAGGGMASPRPFWQSVFVSSTHCGAGCALGDVIGETTVFGTGLHLWGSRLLSDYLVDFCLAYLLGILFQYLAIVPMRHLSPANGVKEAIKADTLSLVAFEIGMFAWMAIMPHLGLPALHPNSPVYWFLMQIGMVIGFFTTYPANWLLVRWGVKKGM